MPVAHLPEADLHYVRRGSGEPLLLIMGMSGNHLHWGEAFMSDLERTFDVIAYDHRGIGRSGRVQEPFSIVDLAEDAIGLIDALEFDSVHVLGISMGGMVAQELVLGHPDRVRTLTLGCTYAGGPDGSLTERAVIEELAAAMLSGDRDRAIRTSWEINVSPPHAAEASSYETFSKVAHELPAAVPVIMAQAQAIAAHDTSARLGEVSVPTLVVHGTADRMLSVDNGRAIAARIPGARLEVLDGVGHLFFWEQPQRSAELVRDLAGLPTIPPPVAGAALQ